MINLIKNLFIFQVFKNYTDVEGNFIDLISKIFKYEPDERVNTLEILGHCYFDEIREKTLEKKLVGINLINLFNFSESIKNLIF